MSEENKGSEHHEHHSAESHERKVVSHKPQTLTEKVRKNPWMLSTFVIGILAVALLILNISGGLTGNVTADVAGEKLLDFYTSVGVSGLSVTSVEKVSGLYLVNFDYNGNEVPIYMTLDGKNLIPGDAVSPLEIETTSETETQEVEKSDIPDVELYVYTYCPYGLQMEKAIGPVVELLGDFVDFKIRQIGAMHGEYEMIEAERQLCIDKYYSDKLMDYIIVFAEDTEIGSCSGDADCLAPLLNSLMNNLGIDSSKINSCMESEGESLYEAEVSNAQSNGVSGSPTLLINGVKVSVTRNPESVKGAICEAFNNVPSACSETLNTDSASAGFGAGSGSSSSASC